MAIFWIPNFGVANQITPARSEDRRDARFSGSQCRHGRGALGGARGRRIGVAHRTGIKQDWTNGIRIRQKITEFQDAYLPGKLGYGAGSKHTLRFDPDGNVWSSGNPLTRFDRKTKKFTRFDDIPSTYDVKEDKDGNIWFTKPDTGQIGRVDWKTLKVSLWSPPTPKSFPRRMQIDADGIVWFGEFNAGKIGRFDPKTEAFIEYPLPGPEPTPMDSESTRTITFGMPRTTWMCWAALIRKPARPLNIRFRIPKTRFGNFSPMRKAGCGTGRRRTTKSGISP